NSCQARLVFALRCHRSFLLVGLGFFPFSWAGRAALCGSRPRDACSARSEPQAVDEDSRGVENTVRLSALVWLTSAGAIGTRGATTDIVLTAATTGALALFFIAETRTRTSENSGCGLLASLSGVWQRSQLTVLLAGFYLFAGVSLLAKGLVGFIIIFGVIALYYLVRRAWPMRQISLSALWG